MRYLLLILFFSFLNAQGQIPDAKKVEYDKKIYIYETLDDFKNDNGKYVGDFYGTYGVHELIISEVPNKGKRRIIVMGVGGGPKPKTINTKNYWGYKIDKYVFRVNKKVHVALIKIKEKVFYADGDIYLSMIQLNSNIGYSSSTSYYYTGIFYSENMLSKIIDIKKFPKKDKDFSQLTKCLKKAKKRYGSQAKFNSRVKCIEEL